MTEAKETKITPRAQDYPQWYQDVIREADLAEPAEIVKGCMVIKPHGYAIWEKIQRTLDDMFKETGHKNAYFPLLIPESFLKKEAEHVEGFAPEVAVVTHAGGKKLEEPYVIRPTSETIIGYFFSRWISSHRDLPLLINQWANVMRWELKTRMFLRTSEFLWQEGHTAHSSHQEAIDEVIRMLNVYATFVENWMAIPVIKGVKSNNEKFAGAEKSYTIEAMMQDGKALQAGTSHDLGQNFGKAFDVKFQNIKGELEYVWQTSWGVSTRLIGALIMAHSDDDGLVLPPKLASVQVAIVPVFKTKEEEETVCKIGDEISLKLKSAGVKVVFDKDDTARPGAKYYKWERKGVPLRIELGPRDIAKNQVVLKARIEKEKMFVSMDRMVEEVKKSLDKIQKDLFNRALEFRKSKTINLKEGQNLVEALGDGYQNHFINAYWCGSDECEMKIKETKATIRCIPLEEHTEHGKCLICGKDSTIRPVIAKAY